MVNLTGGGLNLPTLNWNLVPHLNELPFLKTKLPNDGEKCEHILHNFDNYG